MKTILLASTILFAAGKVFAADAATDLPSPETAPAGFVWTGGYVGLNVGFGGGKVKHRASSDVFPGVGSGDFDSNGFLGGVQAGYNYQIDRWLIGVEADFQGSGLNGDGPVLFDGMPLPITAGTKLDWYGTMRARAGGLVTDRFLVYATGGLAYGRTKSYLDLDLDGGGHIRQTATKTKTGWTVGSGAEYAINDRVSLKTEYAYTDLGQANIFSGKLGQDGPLADFDRKISFHSIKVGINYKF